MISAGVDIVRMNCSHRFSGTETVGFYCVLRSESAQQTSGGSTQ